MKQKFELQDIFPSVKNECEVRSVLDTDMYKILMLDFILANPEYKNLNVSWKMKIRTKWIKTAEVIPLEDLKNQLEMVKNMNWITVDEYEYLKNYKTPNWEKSLNEETLEFLKNLKLSDYTIWVDDDGNYELEFIWAWPNSMLWEIYWLKIINALYAKNYILKDNLVSEEISQIINSTLDRLYSDIEIFKQTPELRFAEFGTRRALSAPFQEMMYGILRKEIPQNCVGTSNVYLSKLTWTFPIGTNAHELRMIPTALYDESQKIIDTMYEIDRQWMKHFPGMGILLPDTFGTSFYYKNCPQDILEDHSGTRFDSKDPLIAIPEYVNWLLENWQDPKMKAWIPSDWLDASLTNEIQKTHEDTLWKLSFWIGTNLSNNTKGTYPIPETHGPFGSFSVVIKPSKVQRPDGTWVSTVKLSDNFEKAMWEKNRVELFKKIFGNEGMEQHQTLV